MLLKKSLGWIILAAGGIAFMVVAERGQVSIYFSLLGFILVAGALAAVLSNIKPEFSRLWLILFLVVLSGAIIYFFVRNPGGAIAARLLNYQTIFRAYRQHIVLTVVASAAAIIVSVTLGILITRPGVRVIAPIVDTVVSIAQTIPSLAILALFFVYLGRGFNTAVFALWLYALLPILRNTSAAIQSIPPNIIEAAYGMGMSRMHILRRIELPLSLPVIMAGIRTSVVVTVGAAALATFIGAGGLGDLIVTGLTMSRTALTICGASLSALLAILLDQILGGVENYLKKR